MTTYLSLIQKYGKPTVKYKGDKLLKSPIKKLELEKFKEYWKNSNHYEWPSQPWYTGTGLQFNPELKRIPHSEQVCGNHYNIKEYQDTLSFNQFITPIFDQWIEYPLVRSKITCLSASQGVVDRKTDWHRDETCFEALRVIIPLETHPNYLLQLDNQSPQHLEVGFAYAFDQGQYHRVLSSGVCSVNRIHLILSMVLWYDLLDGVWLPNHNHNKIHPMDVFKTLKL